MGPETDPQNAEHEPENDPQPRRESEETVNDDAGDDRPISDEELDSVSGGMF